MHQMTDQADGTLYTVYSQRNPGAGNTMDVYLKIYGSGGPAPGGPPYVVSTSPKDADTNVPVNTKIDVTWNESMNQGSAESAFSSNPSITCGWTWSGVKQTCTPSANLQGNTQYKITISTTAKDSSGTSMKNPYYFNFTTEQGTGPNPPTVSSTTPADQATNVGINTNIAITFTEVMDKPVTEGAISASPGISGTFAWDGTAKIVTWDPTADLTASTKYTVTVSVAAKSAAGKNMAAAFSFSFTTGTVAIIPPTITDTSPANNDVDVPTNTKISMTFSKAMDKIVTAGAISANPAVTWTTAWSVGDTVVEFSPSADLSATTKYTITTTTAAKSADGANLANQHTFSFTTAAGGDTTPPTVKSTDPTTDAKDVDKAKKIAITFSEAMDKTVTAAAVSISPGSITTRAWDSTSKVLTLSVTMTDGTKYTVTISTSAKDQAGNKMAADYVFSFTTKAGGGGGGGGGIDTMTLGIIIVVVVVVVVMLLVLMLMRKKKQPPAPMYPQYGPPQDQQMYYDQGQQPPPPGY
jgi:methionine-rich copper-binding protein CopC